MSSSNVKNVSDLRPKCFCDETCWTGLPLEKIGRGTTFLLLRVKISSCGYPWLDGSGLKLIYLWKVHSFIFSKFAQSCFAVALGSLIIVNKEM